ncbi:MAG: hypothetical protein RL653_3655, partial [Pseudomonadota bacterium]
AASQSAGKVGSDGWTTGPQRALVPPPGAAPTLEVDRQHPVLQKLARAKLATGKTGSCVRTTLGNMDRLGIPSFSGGTSADPNNSRGALVQLIKGGHWASVPLADSTVRTIRSPYGTVQAHVMSADAYERLANKGEIPSGALIFQTRHGWNYGGGASGNDMGIVRDRGRTTHNYASMPPIIYGNAKEVVLLVPKAALRPVAAPAEGA